MASPGAWVTHGWIIGTEPRFTARVAGTLNCCTISLSTLLKWAYINLTHNNIVKDDVVCFCRQQLTQIPTI